MTRMNFLSDPKQRINMAILCAMLVTVILALGIHKRHRERPLQLPVAQSFRTDTPVVKKMKVTAYCPCVICCGGGGGMSGKIKKLLGTGMGTGLCADGSKARHGVIAADPKYRFGTVMSVPGYHPLAEVRDRGSAIAGDHIDIYFDSHERAKKWGVQYHDVIIHPTEKPKQKPVDSSVKPSIPIPAFLLDSPRKDSK